MADRREPGIHVERSVNTATRSTTKLNPVLRCTLLATLAVASMAAIGGCATNASRDWAQTAPVIAPEPDGATTVSLGASKS